MGNWSSRKLSVSVTLGIAAMLVALGGAPSAQVRTAGRTVAPVFEGWEPNGDGSFNLVFGYFSRNWEEDTNVPIGPSNTMDPGGPDQGQPTRFYPQRNRFIFRVHVSKDFGKNEVVWTLTTHGETERAYGTLKPDYMLNNGIIEANFGGGAATEGAEKNKAPVLKIDGDQTRHAKVGMPLTLTALATDDGIPAPRPGLPLAYIGRGSGVTSNATGLRFSWLVYRGAGKVTFDPPQFEAWEDIREAHNSPYAPGWVTPAVPASNTWTVRATFDEAGTYVLRGLAHDGSQATDRDITVIVTQ
jgi:hypothetical protein